MNGIDSIPRIINEYTRMSFEERRFCLYKVSKPLFPLYKCVVVRGTNIVVDNILWYNINMGQGFFILVISVLLGMICAATFVKKK